MHDENNWWHYFCLLHRVLTMFFKSAESGFLKSASGGLLIGRQGGPEIRDVF
jgi:hypothetical protein